MVPVDFLRNIAVVSPTGKGAASRSFEALAELAPGANADTYGVSIGGATSPENQYIIDGVSVNDPGFGINGSPLSVEFMGEVNVISGGYLPEYGRSTGGVVNAVTKSGSNEFHGSVFGNLTPGALASRGTEILQEAGTVSGRTALWNLADVGFGSQGLLLPVPLDGAAHDQFGEAYRVVEEGTERVLQWQRAASTRELSAANRYRSLAGR